MAPHFNSASRVLAIFEKVAKQGGGQSAEQAWVNALGITAAAGVRRPLLVAEQVGKIIDEVELVHEYMKGTLYNKDRFEPVFEKAYQALNTNNLQASWNNFQTHLSESTLLGFGFFSEMLPHEEDPIDSAELEELAQQLQELKQHVRESGLPAHVKAFLLQQIRNLLDAIRDYPITGQKVFTEAFGRLSTNIAVNRELIRQYNEEPEFQTNWQRLGDAWGKVRNRVETVQLLYSVYQHGQALGEVIRPLLGG
ncbi:MAG: hypothetical protein M3R24_41580 [Chloroflexota bacterium]|nr:hypothetical protein [Chloroflexota bacterium]